MVILLFTFLFYNQASCPFTRDNPIKTADSIVNTYAWMNATRISNASIKIPNATATTVMEPLMTGPTFR